MPRVNRDVMKARAGIKYGRLAESYRSKGVSVFIWDGSARTSGSSPVPPPRFVCLLGGRRQRDIGRLFVSLSIVQAVGSILAAGTRLAGTIGAPRERLLFELGNGPRATGSHDSHRNLRLGPFSTSKPLPPVKQSNIFSLSLQTEVKLTFNCFHSALIKRFKKVANARRARLTTWNCRASWEDPFRTSERRSSRDCASKERARASRTTTTAPPLSSPARPYHLFRKKSIHLKLHTSL